MKIVFFGDSVTQGCFESSDPSGAEWVYHKKLSNMWAGKDIQIINAGVGGDSAEMGYQRLNQDVISYSPDIVVVCFGLNDASQDLGHLKDYLISLEKIFLGLKGIRTIFMTPNMLNTYSHNETAEQFRDFSVKTAKIQNSGVMDQFMQSAVQCAEQNNVEVCDCYQEWKKLQCYGIDTTLLLANRINHPTRKMHQLFADQLYKTIGI